MADGLADEKAALLVRLGEDCAFHCAGLGGWRCHADADADDADGVLTMCSMK